ncbi:MULTISPECIES: DUF2057 family protein [Marinobacter]|uniref:DUF2057 family protein n=1 Tax=Marinobacter xiaoshiensis TaxID=3073652 RepID=A0ABU2HHP7_9GAMM|nr:MULTISPECIES: DUF2057 family protein [unclassified Marinobacter]MBK1874687.1 DUF2057 family protein [Marinobacter sp. 1-3A]MBK1888130.1 DUF2057 family protein [Marinobacter sp. DY40_1A1]MDS1310585.1 DUF2057 family protein [Marinobacter sp. F60267]
MSMVHILRVARLEMRCLNRWSQMCRFVFASLLLTTLVGCSMAVTKLETWEGEPAGAENAAVLKAPGVIHVSQVNGREMKSYLMDDLALDYALLPGENEVVFTYKTIWAKSGVVDNGESKVHVIESKPQVVRFEASPDAIYQFEFSKPESRKQAEKEMPEFSAAIVGAEGAALAYSTNWSPADSPRADRAPMLSDGNAVADDGVDALSRLKSVWETASDEDKKAFLRWAFE